MKRRKSPPNQTPPTTASATVETPEWAIYLRGILAHNAKCPRFSARAIGRAETEKVLATLDGPSLNEALTLLGETWA